MKPQLENVVVKLAPEAPLVPVLPLPVDDFEGDVFVGRAGVDPQDAEVFLRPCRAARDQLVIGRRVLVDQVGVEYVELVALQSEGNNQ